MCVGVLVVRGCLCVGGVFGWGRGCMCVFSFQFQGGDRRRCASTNIGAYALILASGGGCARARLRLYMDICVRHANACEKVLMEALMATATSPSGICRGPRPGARYDVWYGRMRVGRVLHRDVRRLLCGNRDADDVFKVVAIGVVVVRRCSSLSSLFVVVVVGIDEVNSIASVVPSQLNSPSLYSPLSSVHPITPPLVSPNDASPRTHTAGPTPFGRASPRARAAE